MGRKESSNKNSKNNQYENCHPVLSTKIDQNWRVQGCYSVIHKHPQQLLPTQYVSSSSQIPLQLFYLKEKNNKLLEPKGRETTTSSWKLCEKVS